MPTCRNWIRIVLTAIFAIIAVAQGIGTGCGGDTLAAPTLRAATAITAAGTAWGIWRRRTWAAAAAVAYGVITAIMLVVLGPMLGLPPEAQSGMRAGAISVLLFCLATAWYLRRDIRSAHRTPNPQEQR